MQVIIGIIGAIYNWHQEGRKENFWKRVFLRNSETMEEMNRDYYAGLYIFWGICIVIALVILLLY